MVGPLPVRLGSGRSRLLGPPVIEVGAAVAGLLVRHIRALCAQRVGQIGPGRQALRIGLQRAWSEQGRVLDVVAVA